MATLTFFNTIGTASDPLAQSLGTLAFRDLTDTGSTGFGMVSGDIPVGTVQGTGLTYGGSGTEVFLTGGTITGFSLFQTLLVGDTPLVSFTAEGLSLSALRFDELFFGRPGHSLDDANQVALLIVAGNDLIHGSTAIDLINAGDGRDTVSGGAADDFLAGDGGDDLVSGGAGDDDILGGRGSDNLFGDAGNDFIKAGAGRDRIDGGGGADEMIGNGGRDTFVFSTIPQSRQGADTIESFQVRKDKIAFNGFVFDALGLSGPLDPEAFVRGNQAREEDDHIIYSRATGRLFYDGDGVGGDDAVLIATIEARGDLGPRLNAGHFVVETLLE